MAFLGRMNSQGSLIDCEVFRGPRSKKQSPRSPASSNEEDDESCKMPPHSKCSRTYIRTYDEGSLLRAMGSPSTVRYVGSSVSSSDLVSLDETETSTLRCGSLPSTGTPDEANIDEGVAVELELYSDPETLRVQLDDSGSSSLSSGSRSGSSQLSSYREEDKDSTTSMCSWEEAMSRNESMRPSQDSNLSATMSSLQLNSGRGSPPLTYTRRLDPLRLERPAAEAYQNWLSAKRRQRQCKQQAERAEQAALLERTALRERLSKERYDQWCRQKTQHTCTASSTPAIGNTHTGAPPRNSHAGVPPRKYPNPQRNHLHEWEMQKLREAEQRRLELQRARRRQMNEKIQRQQDAEQAFQRWVKNVAQRPKPVPSCQGMQSLRGTISSIYINPKQWIK
ncbi:uncharacterized protein [Drosophila bipectinata]|uniref:uncharacterized protein n=1 Tax=Drosophila bipectinata TaxID=42026 RepID=UPI001C8A6284|nr:uncharacterized protein LOC108126699 [Drosophila bipectinata]